MRERDSGRDAKIFRPAAIRSNAGVLARIVTGSININAIREMDGGKELYMNGIFLLDLLQDVDLFERVVIAEPPPPLAIRYSKHMLHHLTDMLLYSVVEETKRVRLCMPLFTVPKKEGTLRLILDCRPLNRSCDKPPPMHLPDIFEVLEYLFQNEVATQCDCRSWFYQFPPLS